MGARLSLLIILILSYVPSWSIKNQDQVDSLIRLLKTNQADTTQIIARLKLADYYLEDDATAAFINIDEAITKAIQIGDKHLLAKGYESFGKYYEINNQCEKAIEVYARAETIFKAINEPLNRALILNRMAIIYCQTGSQYKALSYFSEVVSIRLEELDTVGLAAVYMNIGNIYLLLEKYDYSKEYYLRSLRMSNSMSDIVFVSKVNTNLGLLALETKALNEARTFFLKALLIDESEGMINRLGSDYTNLAVTYVRLEQFDSATHYFDKAELINRDLNNRYENLHTSISQAEFSNAKGDFKTGLSLASNSYQAAFEMGLADVQKQASFLMYQANNSLGNYKDALENYVLYSTMRDSLRSGGERFEVQRLEENNELGFRLKEVETRLAESKLKARSFWQEDWFLLVTFFLIIGVFIAIFEFRRKKNSSIGTAEFENINYLRSTRIFLVITALLICIPLKILPTAATYKYDPYFNRILIFTALLGFYVLTYWSRLVRTHLDLISKLVYLALIGYFGFLLQINNISFIHFTQFMILMTAQQAVFKQLRNIVFFGILIQLFVVLITLNVDYPVINPLFVIGSFIALFFVQLIFAYTYSDLDLHLEFSNEVVHQADALVFIVNRKGENIYTSQSITSILGYTPQELREHDWIERLGLSRSEALHITNELILIAIGTISVTENPYQRFIAKNGKEVWLSIKEKRLSKDRVLVIGVDVTKNKKIQDELANSERNFRQINETLSDVFYLYNLQLKQYEYITPNSAEIVGPPPDFFYDNQDYVKTFIVPEDRRLALEAFARISAGIPYDVEYRINIGDELKWIREKSYPIFDENQVVIKNSGLCQDITARKKAEQEIQKLSLIASNTDNFILMVDVDNQVEWANASFYKLTGFTEREAVGRRPLELISGRLTDEQIIEDISTAIFIDHLQMQCELVCYKRDQTIFHSSIEVTPLLDENGELEKYFVIGSDISQRKADQDQIEKLSLVASNTSNYVIIAHAEKGIEWVNPAFEEKFNYSFTEIEGSFPFELLHEKGDNETLKVINETIFETRKKYTGEVIHLTKNGDKVFANVDITPIIGEDNRIEKYFILGVDISERIKYEEEIERTNRDLSLKERQLNESEQNFRELIKSIKEVFYLRDMVTGNFIFVSESYEDLFGQPVSRLMEVQTSWTDNMHPQDRKRVINAFKNRKETNGVINQDFRLIMPSGEEKWANFRAFSIFNEDGKEVMISGLTEDITAKKRQELEIKKIADQLEIIHSIEKTILQSDSTEAIIYNTLEITLNKLPILKSSLILFDESNESYFVYSRLKGESQQLTDKKEFPLSNFQQFHQMNATRSNIIEDISKKENQSNLEQELINQGVTIVLMTPLVYGDRLIGSLNVGFVKSAFEGTEEHYLQVTDEVATGLALAIEQSQLRDNLHLSSHAIQSSIEYAKMIQQAYIPTSLSIGKHFTNHFILNRPKDIVSGDFYWVGEFGDTKVIAVGDCTGHGVPGAFMTIIGISELNNIVCNLGIVDPAEVLNALNLAIITALSSSAVIQLKDGMDIGIFCYNTKTNLAKFAGARRPLYQYNGESLKLILGAKRSIGDATGDTFGIVFETIDIPFKHTDTFYLFSDGVTDQFGGDRIRKFSQKRVVELLSQIGSEEIEIQHEKISTTLTNWQGKQLQTDDMVFVGFKVS